MGVIPFRVEIALLIGSIHANVGAIRDSVRDMPHSAATRAFIDEEESLMRSLPEIAEKYELVGFKQSLLAELNAFNVTVSRGIYRSYFDYSTSDVSAGLANSVSEVCAILCRLDAETRSFSAPFDAYETSPEAFTNKSVYIERSAATDAIKKTLYIHTGGEVYVFDNPMELFLTYCYVNHLPLFTLSRVNGVKLRTLRDFVEAIAFAKECKTTLNALKAQAPLPASEVCSTTDSTQELGDQLRVLGARMEDVANSLAKLKSRTDRNLVDNLADHARLKALFRVEIGIALCFFALIAMLAHHFKINLY